MATYAIGDIQGCYKTLMALLKQIQFNIDKDTLWLSGDMVNRGPGSKETLQYLYKIRDNVVAVLGNHDLHLLAVACGDKPMRFKDTLEGILIAHNSDQLLDWVRHRPLIHHDEIYQRVLVHAGIPPIWSVKEAKRYAKEVETVLRSDVFPAFLDVMYGNQPDIWNKSLVGMDRMRLITNYLTRMRFCTVDGRLDLECKLGPKDAPKDFAPWFTHRKNNPRKNTVLFGHWASLEGVTNDDKFIALDTGCVWGRFLSAYCLETQQWSRCNFIG